MPSSATSSLFIIDEGHWALARGSLGDAFQSWWPAVHWSLSPALRLCPSSQLILQTVFWQLKRHLGSDRDSFYTHTSTSPLSVPLLSSHESPNAFRMWEMATHRGENECLSQEETIWNALRGRMMGVGDIDFFFFLFNFSNFQDFTLEKFGDCWHRIWKDDSTTILVVFREFQMEFRECCKCISPLHQNIKKGLWHV